MIAGETVSASRFSDEAVRLTGLEYSDCFFDNCSLAETGSGQSPPRPPDAPVYSYIGQSTFARSCQRSCSLSAVLLDEVLVDGLSRQGRSPLFLSAVVFRHVVLRGRISFFKLNAAPQTAPTPRQRERWLTAQAQSYRDVDWALDISKAEFTFGPDLHYVPGDLVRRDEETQALLRRTAVQDVPLPTLPWGDSGLRIAADWFLEDGPYDSVVLVAARKSRTFRDDLAALEMLRREGLAA